MRLQRRLAQQVALKEQAVTLPRAGQTYTILMPSDHDHLLDQAEQDPEQQLPYWAEIWPSGIALGDVVLSRQQEFARQPVLELGCGLGITATAALAAGAKLLVTDYSTISLDLCHYNALRNVGREPEKLAINWRLPSDDLLQRAAAIGGYPIILAADLLYERRDILPLLSLVGRLLAPTGTLWLAEPGRDTAQRFLKAAAEQGWSCASQRHAGPWVGDSTVAVGVHFLTRSVTNSATASPL